METPIQNILLVLTFLSGAWQANAQVSFTSGIINVDFYYYTIQPGYGPGAGAIGSAGDLWNQVLWPTYSGELVTGLTNNSGTATTVGLHFENSSGGGGSFTGTYGALFGLYESFAATSQIDQITGLTPNAQYDLYLYSPAASTLSVNGTSFSWTAATRPENSLVLGTGYNMNIVTADGSGNLSISAPSGSGEISALQLTPAVSPAPSLSIASSSAFVLTTNGSGSFSLPASYPVSNAPNSVVAFTNVDGLVDLACVSASGNTLTLLTNDGLGGFAVKTNIATLNRPSAITAADVNGDGKMDLIYAAIIDPSVEGIPGSLTVLTNDGSGNFVLSATYTVGSYTVAVTTADVNNDGHPDLICANFGNYQQGSLSVLTNDGQGGFATAATINAGDAGGFGPLSVTAADVNKDGFVDLICVNNGPGGTGNTLLVFTNDGSAGGFTLASSPTVGNGPDSVTAADVNNDGWADLICANGGSGDGNTLSVLTNDRSGAFALSTTPVIGTYPVFVTVADLNGDGWTDLICANSSGLAVLTNDHYGGFVVATNIPVTGGTACVAVADVNGDGWPDLVSADSGGASLSVFTNTATVRTNGVAGVVVSWPSPSTGFVLQQNTDLTTTNWTASSYSITTNNGTNSIVISPATGNLFFRLVNP